MKLNGWQRIWIVSSVIIFVIVMVFTIALLPKKSEITSRWAYETIDVVKQPNEYSYQIRDAYKDLDDNQVMNRIHEIYAEGNKVVFEKIDKRYNSELDGLLARQTKYILVGLVVSLCLIFVMYGLGWSIGWIYRGFKSH